MLFSQWCRDQHSRDKKSLRAWPCSIFWSHFLIICIEPSILQLLAGCQIVFRQMQSKNILSCGCNIAFWESTKNRWKTPSLAYMKALCESGEAPWHIGRARMSVVRIDACLLQRVPEAAAEEAQAQCRIHDWYNGRMQSEMILHCTAVLGRSGNSR